MEDKRANLKVLHGQLTGKGGFWSLLRAARALIEYVLDLAEIVLEVRDRIDSKPPERVKIESGGAPKD